MRIVNAFILNKSRLNPIGTYGPVGNYIKYYFTICVCLINYRNLSMSGSFASCYCLQKSRTSIFASSLYAAS